MPCVCANCVICYEEDRRRAATTTMCVCVCVCIEQSCIKTKNDLSKIYTKDKSVLFLLWSFAKYARRKFLRIDIFPLPEFSRSCSKDRSLDNRRTIVDATSVTTVAFLRMLKPSQRRGRAHALSWRIKRKKRKKENRSWPSSSFICILISPRMREIFRAV